MIRCRTAILFLVLAVLGGTGLHAQQASAGAGAAPGTVFKDCKDCPEMVVIPPGTFQMGSDERTREGPIHAVTFARPVAVGRFTVTFDEWDACVADGGCQGYRPDDHGWGRGRRPVINVSWDDAQSYVVWLSRHSGQPYRLLSEAEWEYAARAGTRTEFWWGNSYDGGHANCDGCGSQWDDRQTAPVGSFPPNAFGVYDMAGNVTVWVEDRWHPSYENAPADGTVWTNGDPLRRVMRGGSWFNTGSLQRTAYRNGDNPRIRNIKIGFRVARGL